MIPEDPAPAGAGLRLPAELDQLPALLDYVRRMARTAGLSGAQASRLELAVEEALANVCGYAYADRAQAGTVLCQIEVRPNGLVANIVDEGAPFDPLTRPDPDTTHDLDRREPGGLGILLIKSLVNDVAYRREGGRNVLIIEMRK